MIAGHRRKGMKIAELCAASGLTRSTIHNYLRMGLLPPATRAGLNLHLYDETHLATLRRIRKLREEDGLSLREIRSVLAGEPPGSAPSPTEAPTGGREEPDKGQQIVQKAIYLFSQFGYENVKVSDITESLAMGKGTFYLYFKNKKELLLECFKTLSRLVQPLERKDLIVREDDFFLRMRNRWVGFQPVYPSFSGILNLLRTAANSTDEEVRNRARESYDEIIKPLRDDLAASVRRGVVREVDPDFFAYILFGIAEQAAFRHTLDDRYTTEGSGEVMLDLLRRLLAPSPPGEPAPPGAAGGLCVTVVDRQGLSTELQDATVEGARFLPATRGDAELQIDLGRVRSVSVEEGDGQCAAEVVTRDEDRLPVRVDGEARVAGRTGIGRFQIRLKNVARLDL